MESTRPDVVVIIPYAFIGLQSSPFQLGLVLAVGGIGALAGATLNTVLGNRLGTGGAIICSNTVTAVGVLIMVGAGLAPMGWAAAAVLAAGEFCHGWAMGVSNSHEMSYRHALTPDALQARTNTTIRSLNRAVLVVVSPIAGLLADRFGFAQAVILVLSPFRRARVT